LHQLGSEEVFFVPVEATDMAAQIVPTENELKGVDMSNSETLSLIQHAEQSDAADKQLTIRQALKKYKKVSIVLPNA
jgi:hypothetical protein